MRSFFIDLENVRSYGLEGILLLKPEDKVYVFYSDNANTLTIPTIESLNESSAQVKYIKTNYIGANAMDFQIVTLLGASIEKEQKGNFYIISHDNGFKSAVKFCDGYFTGYDIVTGVFANILLAINSEKNIKSGKIQDSSSEKERTSTQKNKNNGKNNGKNNKTTSVSLNEQSSETTGNAGEDDSSDVNGKPSGNRNRRRRGRGHKPGQDKDITTTIQEINESDSRMQAAEKFANGEKNAEISEGSANPAADIIAETENKKSRSRNRRRRGRNHDRSETEVINSVPENNDQLDASENTGSEDGFMIIQANSEQDDVKKNNQKSGRNKSKKNRNNSDSIADNVNSDVSVKMSSMKNEPDSKKQGNNQAANKSASTPKYSGNYKYVHDALSDFLSKTTIDMYAAKIDEGIKSSANRNELHAFFKKSYGQDEAEALYKIIASDFDKMKKEAGK